MLELVKAGGWPMIPLLLLSALALALIVERAWTLRRNQVLPPGLGREVRTWAGGGKLDPTHIESLRATSPLGALLAAALDVRDRPRQWPPESRRAARVARVVAGGTFVRQHPLQLLGLCTV